MKAEVRNDGPRESLLDSLPTGVLHLRDEKIVYANSALARLLGAPVESLIGAYFWSFVESKDAELVRRRYDARQRGETTPATYQIGIVRADGSRTRAEIEPRKLGEGESIVAVRDLGDAVRDIELSNRLSALALEVQRERSVEGVIAATARGLARLGLRLALMQTVGDQLVLHTADLGADRLGGHEVEGARFSLQRMSFIPTLLREGRALYLDQLDEALRSALRAVDLRVELSEDAREQILGEALAALGPRKGLLAPLYVGDMPWGVLFVGSDSLTPRDGATLNLFASQLGTALEVARAMEELHRSNGELRAFQSENERLYSATRQQVDWLSFLQELSHVLAQTLEEGPIAEGSLRLLVERLQADGAWLYRAIDGRLLLMGERTELQLPPELAAKREHDIRPSSTCGVSALDRKTIRIDLSECPETEGVVARRYGLRHVVTVPLVVDGRLAGLLSLGRKDRSFGGEEVRLLEACASQLGVALERSRIFGEERRLAIDLARINELGTQLSQQHELPAVLALGIEHLERLVDVPMVFLQLLDGEDGPLRVAATNVSGEGLVGKILEPDSARAAYASLREGRPVIRETPEPTPLSYLGIPCIRAAGVPLVSRGRPIGAVILAENRPGRDFRPQEIERAVAFANQLAAAITNARLIEEQRRRVRELSLLSEIGRIATSAVVGTEAIAQSLARVCESLGFCAGGIWEATASRGLEQAARHGDESASGFLETLAAEAGRADRAAEGREGAWHGLALPLAGAERTHAVLSLARAGGEIRTDDRRILAAVSNALGIALQHVRHYDDARRRVEELQLLLEVGRAITGSLDLGRILESSAGALIRLVDGSNAFVLLLDDKARELHGVACSNERWREQFRQVRIGVDDETSLSAAAVRERRTFTIPDVSRSGIKRRFEELSLLAVPLLLRDQPIGALIIDDVRRPRVWDESEIELATLIAHQIAVAVANARLYEDLRRSYGQLASAQGELVKQERLAALGELAAVVAHEVRNPLGVIFNSLSSLSRLLKPSGDAAMLLGIVEEEADRLDRIIADLLDFARPLQAQLAPERLCELLEQTIARSNSDRAPTNVEVVLDCPADLPELALDQRMMRQVFTNLVINGKQAMPDGGQLQVRVALEGARVVRVDVIDRGQGIPPEIASRIFQPFFTTKAAGTGLGLAVVKRFVDAHGGTITFESTLGVGTTFSVRLPVG